jgi:lipopolysaccharide export system permease protein
LVSLARYLLLQHLTPFAMGFGLIVFILVIDVVLQMLDQVLSKGLVAGVALQLFVYNLAWIIALAVPMAVLIAVIMVFGRLAADNELMAMKAAGISFTRIITPVVLAAIVLSLVMIWFNDQMLPDANHRARELASSLKRAKAALVLKQKEGVFLRDLGPYHLLIEHVDEETNRLSDLTLYDTGQPGAPTTLRAATGRLEIFDEGRYIRLTLEDGEYHRIDADDPGRISRGTFGRQVLHIRDTSRDFSGYRSSHRGDREMDIRAMLAAVDKIHDDNERTRSTIDSTAKAFIAELTEADLVVDTADELTEPEPSGLVERGRRLSARIDKQWSFIDAKHRRANTYLVEVHKKFSIAIACVVFVLVGAPLGALTQARGAAVSIAVSLVFFFAFWMFLIGGEELADRGFIPPAVAMWAPNVTFGIIGILLTRAAILDLPLAGLLGRLRRRSGPTRTNTP